MYSEATIMPSGNVLFPGIDHGPGGVILHARYGSLIVVKVKGSTQWKSLGESAYVGTYFMMFELTKTVAHLDNDGIVVKIKHVAEWPARKGKDDDVYANVAQYLERRDRE